MARSTSPSHLSRVDLSVARLVCGKSLARVSSGALLLAASGSLPPPPPLVASSAEVLSSTSGRSNFVLSDGNSGSSFTRNGYKSSKSLICTFFLQLNERGGDMEIINNY